MRRHALKFQRRRVTRIKLSDRRCLLMMLRRSSRWIATMLIGGRSLEKHVRIDNIRFMRGKKFQPDTAAEWPEKADATGAGSWAPYCTCLAAAQVRRWRCRNDANYRRPDFAEPCSDARREAPRQRSSCVTSCLDQRQKKRNGSNKKESRISAAKIKPRSGACWCVRRGRLLGRRISGESVDLRLRVSIVERRRGARRRRII